MSKLRTTCIGCAANLVIISLPLIVIEVAYQALFSTVNVWSFYVLISGFCFFESRANHDCHPYEPKITQHTYHPYVTGGVVLMIFWVALIEYSRILSMFSIYNMVGILLTGAGILLRVKAINTLKQYFLNHIGVMPTHQLITHGIYRIIRHPSEVGLLLICIGISVLMDSGMSLLLTLFILCPLSIYRMSLEDKVMKKKFGRLFIDYQYRTGQLLPIQFLLGLSKSKRF